MLEISFSENNKIKLLIVWLITIFFLLKKNGNIVNECKSRDFLPLSKIESLPKETGFELVTNMVTIQNCYSNLEKFLSNLDITFLQH